MHETTARNHYEPLTWLLIFHTASPRWWVERFVPGRFKHVSACCFVDAAKVWLFYDIELNRTRVFALPDEEGPRLIARRRIGGEMLRMPVLDTAPAPWHRLGFWCVPAIKHLIGLRSGALLPDALWRDCLAAGATIIADDSRRPRIQTERERPGGAAVGRDRQAQPNPGLDAA